MCPKSRRDPIEKLVHDDVHVLYRWLLSLKSHKTFLLGKFAAILPYIHVALEFHWIADTTASVKIIQPDIFTPTIVHTYRNGTAKFIQMKIV